MPFNREFCASACSHLSSSQPFFFFLSTFFPQSRPDSLPVVALDRNIHFIVRGDSRASVVSPGLQLDAACPSRSGALHQVVHEVDISSSPTIQSFSHQRLEGRACNERRFFLTFAFPPAKISVSFPASHLPTGLAFLSDLF